MDDFLEDDESKLLVPTLLKSDKDLLDVVLRQVQSTQNSLVEITSCIQVLDACRKYTAALTSIPFSSLYLRAIDDELKDSATLREFYLTVKKAPSDVLSQLLPAITPFVASSAHKSLDKVRQQLKDLLKKVDIDKGPLRSQHDVRNETLRTTVVAHKVELSKHKASISENDAAYSKILDNFYEWLKGYVDGKLGLWGGNTLFAEEVVIYDTRGPDKAAFMPKHRFAVERALSSPHDYLNCDCCKGSRDGGEDQVTWNSPIIFLGTEGLHNLKAALGGTQPVTALLYQLYLESGSSINVTDLWSAFNAMIGDEGVTDDQQTA